jgi:hypothetical protein
MPILHGDRLIGRVDPRLDRRAGVLHVDAVTAEPEAPEGVGAEVAGPLARLAGCAWRRARRARRHAEAVGGRRSRECDGAFSPPRGAWGAIAIDWLASPLMLVFPNEFRIAARPRPSVWRSAASASREALDQPGLDTSPSCVGFPQLQW